MLDWQMFPFELYTCDYFYRLGVLDRGIETQLQVGENVLM